MTKTLHACFTIAAISYGLAYCSTLSAIAKTHNVQDFIAAAGFPTEHSAAIQRGIDKTDAGATLYFPPGFYQLSVPLRLKSFQTYRGSRQAILSPAGERALPVMLLENTTSVIINGLTFQGGGIRLSGHNQTARIENNTFQDIFDSKATFGNEAAIFIAGPLTNGSIRANTFKRVGLKNERAGAKNAAALLAYHLQQTHITDNTFQDVYQAISLIFEGKRGSGDGITVTGNNITNAVRMGIEAQGKGASGVLIEANTVTMHQTGDEDIGLSIVLTNGVNTVVKSNTVKRISSPSSSCAGMGIEVTGINTLVTKNDVRGPWCSAIAVSTTNNQFSNVVANSICGHSSQYDVISFYNGRGASTSERNTIRNICN